MVAEDDVDPTARVANLLLDETVKRSIRIAYEKILLAHNDYRPIGRKWPFQEVELSLSLSRAVASACEADGALRKLFARRVIAKIARPNLVAEDDLCAAFVATIRTELADFDVAYRLFVGQVINRIECDEHVLHLPFCWHQNFKMQVMQQDEDGADNSCEALKALLNFDDEERRLFDLDDLEPLWSKNGVSLKLEVTPASMAAGEDKHWPSGGYHRRLAFVLDGASSSALRSMADSLGKCVEVIAACIDPVPETVNPTRLSIEAIVTERATISELMDCLLQSSPAAENDKLAERIGTGLRLLSEAASQNATALSLALTVTALEALLGKKGSSAIANEIAERVAILMESRIEYRMTAEKFVKELYDHRSRVLHGEDIGPRDEWYRKARFLVLRVVYRIIQFRLFRRKLAIEELLSPEQLIDEIHAAKYDSSLFTGQIELDDVATFLWCPAVQRRR